MEAYIDVREPGSYGGVDTLYKNYEVQRQACHVQTSHRLARGTGSLYVT